MQSRELPNWDAVLRDKGLRVTQPRLAVMADLWQHPHSSADQIVHRAQAVGPLSLQSVYNVLADLGQARLVRSLELPHNPGLYELDFHDNHHHAVCTKCARVVDVPCAVGHTPCLTPSEDPGMTIKIADVVYRGLCSHCQQDQATETNPQGDDND